MSNNPLRQTKRYSSTASPLRKNGPTIKREPGKSALSRGGSVFSQQSQQQKLKQRQNELGGGTFQEYPLRACSAEDIKDVRHHILKFHSKSAVKPSEQFTEPVRFHRKDPRNLQFQLTLSEQQERKRMQQEQQEEEQQQQKQREEANKKEEVDMSVVAPDGGARKKAQPFQKKTRQSHSVNEAERKLRYEEYYPWVMEDFDGKNTWVGNYEAAQSDCYALFMFDKDGFKMVPAEKFYKMTPRNKFATLTIEEAEQRMEKKNMPSRWIMQRISKEQEENATNFRRTFRAVHRGGGSDERREAEDEIDYDEEFADDEEAPIMEGADDEVKEVEDKIKREQRAANTIGLKTDANLELDEENERKIDKHGKKLQKYLRSLEKNNIYSSDDDDANPYASESEDSDDDLFNEPVKKEDEQDIKKEQQEEIPQLPVRREKKVYTNLPAGMAILQLSPQFLAQFKSGIWNANAKRPREEDIQQVVPKQKKTKSMSPGVAASGNADDDLLTENDVRPIIRDKKVTIKELLKELNTKLRKHPDNQKRLKSVIGKIARLHEGVLVLKDE